MNSNEKNQIKSLIKKYNEVLLQSMSIAITEDLINLIVVNGDDTEFQLSHLMKNQQAFKLLVTSEFLKMNASPVLHELKSMDDDFLSSMIKIKRGKDQKAV